MNIPKWLLPVIGVVAALAVGVAAVLIGMQFAPADQASAFVPPQTETATVLAPVPPDAGDGNTGGDPGGGESDGGASGGGASEPAPSPEIGEREVVVPETDPAATDAELLNLINLVGLDPDILAGILRLGLGTIDGDPCSPTDGSTPPDDCPAGLTGAIFASHAVPPLLMLADPWPKTHALLGDVRTGIGELQCDPATAGDGEATVRIRSTVPASWTIRYFPTEHPDQALETTPTDPSEQQQADWHAQLEMDPVGYLMAEQCLVIHGLTADTAYTAVISGNDIFGRPATPRTIPFNGDGAPTHPDLSVQPIGQNLLTATALHRPDETVVMQAYLVDPATAATCDPPGSVSTLGVLTWGDDIPTTSAERNRINTTSQYSQKLFQSYRVPEGATVLLCARWFPGGSTTPTSESAQANYESSVIVQTADRVSPSLTMNGFTPRDARSVDLHWKVSTAEGLVCGEWDWSFGDELPLALCSTAFTTSGGVDLDFASSRISDRGFDGDLVLTVSATLESGETSETTYLLPAGIGSCAGVCDVPADSYYRVATIGGTMELTEHWDQGLQNGGLDHWNVSSTVSNPVDYVRPDTPQIDPSPYWTFDERDDWQPYLDASVDLRVDRHVTWEVTAIDDRTHQPARMCNNSSIPLSDSGESEDGIVHVNLDNACINQVYYTSIRLVDDEGNVAVWDTLDRTHYWGGNAVMVTPRIDITLRYQVEVAWDESIITNRDYFKRFNLIVDGTVSPLANDEADPPGTLCVHDGHAQSDGRLEESVGGTVSIGLEARWGNRGQPGSAQCSGTAWTGDHSTLTSDIPLASFNNPEGVLISWGPSYGGTIRVWAERR
jgi:hypothetical protein